MNLIEHDVFWRRSGVATTPTLPTGCGSSLGPHSRWAPQRHIKGGARVAVCGAVQWEVAAVVGRTCSWVGGIILRITVNAVNVGVGKGENVEMARKSGWM